MAPNDWYFWIKNNIVRSVLLVCLVMSVSYSANAQGSELGRRPSGVEEGPNFFTYFMIGFPSPTLQVMSASNEVLASALGNIFMRYEEALWGKSDSLDSKFFVEFGAVGNQQDLSPIYNEGWFDRAISATARYDNRDFYRDISGLNIGGALVAHATHYYHNDQRAIRVFTGIQAEVRLNYFKKKIYLTNDPNGSAACSSAVISAKQHTNTSMKWIKESCEYIEYPAAIFLLSPFVGLDWTLNEKLIITIRFDTPKDYKVDGYTIHEVPSAQVGLNSYF